MPGARHAISEAFGGPRVRRSDEQIAELELMVLFERPARKPSPPALPSDYTKKRQDIDHVHTRASRPSGMNGATADDSFPQRVHGIVRAHGILCQPGSGRASSNEKDAEAPLDCRSQWIFFKVPWKSSDFSIGSCRGSWYYFQGNPVQVTPHPPMDPHHGMREKEGFPVPVK